MPLHLGDAGDFVSVEVCVDLFVGKTHWVGEVVYAFLWLTMLQKMGRLMPSISSAYVGGKGYELFDHGAEVLVRLAIENLRYVNGSAARWLRWFRCCARLQLELRQRPKPRPQSVLRRFYRRWQTLLHSRLIYWR